MAHRVSAVAIFVSGLRDLDPSLFHSPEDGLSKDVLNADGNGFFHKGWIKTVVMNFNSIGFLACSLHALNPRGVSTTIQSGQSPQRDKSENESISRWKRETKLSGHLTSWFRVRCFFEGFSSDDILPEMFWADAWGCIQFPTVWSRREVRLTRESRNS